MRTRPKPSSPPAASSPADGPLVLAALDGDRGAFGRLHERHAPMVHGLLLARVPAAEADDLVQDVFLHALTRLGGLRDPDAFGPWLAAIARSFTVGFHRRRRGADELPEHLPAEPANPGPLASVGAEARKALAAIQGLPEAYRETLILRLVEGLTGPQIAACTGLTPGSVRVNLHRGLKLLRARLGPELLPEDSP